MCIKKKKSHIGTSIDSTRPLNYLLIGKDVIILEDSMDQVLYHNIDQYNISSVLFILFKFYENEKIYHPIKFMPIFLLYFEQYELE